MKSGDMKVIVKLARVLPLKKIVEIIEVFLYGEPRQECHVGKGRRPGEMGIFVCNNEASMQHRPGIKSLGGLSYYNYV